MDVSLQVQCAECHPEHGLRCQLNPHPATIKHYAVRFQSPMEFYTWATDEELAVWPEPPTLDVWETAPPCSRQDLCGIRVTYMPPLCLIKVDRGNA
jgi:hypothetical protein